MAISEVGAGFRAIGGDLIEGRSGPAAERWSLCRSLIFRTAGSRRFGVGIGF